MSLDVLVLGGGDLASGVIYRLAKSGCRIFATELEQPLMVRRSVSFGEAIYQGEITIEGIHAHYVHKIAAAIEVVLQGSVSLLTCSRVDLIQAIKLDVLIDGRMQKTISNVSMGEAPFIIGLGPGFTVGQNCHALVETKRGPNLGRVLWQGQAEKDSGVPETVCGHTEDRVLRSPADGIMQNLVSIGDWILQGQTIATVNDIPVTSPFDGLLRGLIHNGVIVRKGMKIGDLDPRNLPDLCRYISDKALAIGGGCLEAILADPVRRYNLGSLETKWK